MRTTTRFGQMTVLEVPGTVASPFHHAALIYADEEQYLAGIMPFIEEGLAAGEPVLVAVPTPKLELLRSTLPPTDLLHFAPMETVGRNPAWIIPVWDDFAGAVIEAGGAARGVGEPIWASRSDDELVECQRHESLVNLAFADVSGFQLLCPYDEASLDRTVIDEAHCSHPRLRSAGHLTESSRFRAELPAVSDTPLSPVPVTASVSKFGEGDLASIRRRAAELAAASRLAPSKIDDLMVVVTEAGSNSIRHGGGTGEIALWHDETRFLCEIRDRGFITDPLAGRRRPPARQHNGRGLWLMHQLSDLVQIRAVPHGQVIRLHLLF